MSQIDIEQRLRSCYLRGLCFALVATVRSEVIYSASLTTISVFV